MDIDTCAEGTFARAGNDDKMGCLLDRVVHSPGQVVEHVYGQNIEGRPIKDQPEDITLVTNVDMLCFCGHTFYNNRRN